jgi:hypothetical protein
MIKSSSSIEMDSNDLHSENKTVLTKAYCELIFLLDRGYPKSSALTFVANHHLISKKERSIINRAAISLKDVMKINSGRLEDPHELKGRELAIDLYNQYTLYQSVLDGEPIIQGRDGILRDIFSNLHSKNDLRFDPYMVETFLIGLRELKPKSINLFFDKQRSKSKEHLLLFQDILSTQDITNSCLLLKAVDHHLKSLSDSIILSHDSIILKEVNYSFDFMEWYIKKKNLREKIDHQIISFCCNETRINPL